MPPRFVSIFALFLVLGVAARADDDIHVSGTLEINVESDGVYRASPRANRLNDLYMKSEANLGLHLRRDFSLQTTLKYEPIRSANQNSRMFEDQGVWIEQAYANWEPGNWSLYAGKFNPVFGIAFGKAPGFFGNDYAEDYEMKERLGFGFARRFEADEWGHHEFTASVFRADTTALSSTRIRRAAINDPNMTRPARLSEKDGGLSNDGGLDSYAMALSGDDFEPLPHLAYHLGFRRQGPGFGQTKAEHGYVAALQYGWEIGKDFWFKPMGEYVLLRNAIAPLPQGGYERDITYLTGGYELAWQRWFWAVASTLRDNRPSNNNATGGATERLMATSIGYRFAFGLTAEIGWKRDHVGGHDTDVVGTRLNYVIEF